MRTIYTPQDRLGFEDDLLADELDEAISEILDMNISQRKTPPMNVRRGTAMLTKPMKAIPPIPARRTKVNPDGRLITTVNNFDDQSLDSAGPAAALVPLLIEGAFQLFTWTVGELRKGEVVWTGQKGFNLIWSDKPSNLNFQVQKSQRTVISYRYANPLGLELVNIQLVCEVWYNGPEFQSRFWFKPGGNRARLDNDVYITITDPFTIETIPTSSAWQRIGIKRYPVIEIPINFDVDLQWPLSNYHESFRLVLSGMYGFGASASDLRYIKDKQKVTN